MAIRPLLVFASLLVLVVVAPSLLAGREDADLVAQAREYAQADRNAESAELFARALRHTPTLRDEILREYADQLLYAGHAQDSIPLFRETLDSPSLGDLEKRRALRSLALAYLWSNDFERAIETYDATLQLMPDDPDLLRNKVDAIIGAARADARNDLNKRAAQRFALAMDLAPERRDVVLREYADQVLYSGRAGDSIALLREVLENPATGTDDRNRALRSLALAYLWSSDHERAIETYDAALRAMPGDADLLRNKASALIGAARKDAREHRNDRSAERFAMAIDLAPERRGELLREQADQLLYSGGAAEAVEFYREIVETEYDGRPQPTDLLSKQALALLWSGRPDQAAMIYQRVLKLQPDNDDARRNLAKALVAQARREAAANDNVAAADHFARAFVLVPDTRREFMREFADQLTYAGRAAEAVGLYHDIIAAEYHGRPPPVELLSALALALLRSQQEDEALRVYGRVLKLRPNDKDARRNMAEALVVLARRDAAANRNSAAADRFAQAIALSPGRRYDWLKDYADQLTYSERTDQAIPLYHELLHASGGTGLQAVEVRLSLGLALSWSGDLLSALAEYDALIEQDPDNLRARLGRAEVLAWLERHDAAAAELRRVFAERPEDANVRRRLARIESYRGRYREAVSLAEPLLEDDPADAEAAIIVAESHLWMGRPDAAIKTLNALPETGLADSRVRELHSELMPRKRPSTSVNGAYSTQSDDLDIASLHIVQRFVLNDGATEFGPQYRRIDYNPEQGVGVEVNRLGGFFRHRFDEMIEVSSSFFVDIQDGQRDHTIFTHDTYLTLFPGDMWRFDIGASRTTLDNIQSLNLGIHVDTFNASVDFWPTRHTKLTARGAWSDYSDGNERWWAQAEVRQRLRQGPDVWIGGRFTKFDFSRRLNNGYFNPDDLQSVEATFQIYGRLYKDLTYDLYGSAGYEDPDPDPSKFIWSGGAKLRHPVVDRVELEAGVDHSSSTLGSDSGFERTTIGIGLSARW